MLPILRALALCVAWMVSGPAAAQTVVDGSGARIPPADLRKVLNELKSRLHGMEGIEVRGLVRDGGRYGYCGEFKTPTRDFLSFTPFHAGLSPHLMHVRLLPRDKDHPEYAEMYAFMRLFGCITR